MSDSDSNSNPDNNEYYYNRHGKYVKRKEPDTFNSLTNKFDYDTSDTSSESSVIINEYSSYLDNLFNIENTENKLVNSDSDAIINYKYLFNAIKKTREYFINNNKLISAGNVAKMGYCALDYMLDENTYDLNEANGCCLGEIYDYYLPNYTNFRSSNKYVIVDNALEYIYNKYISCDETTGESLIKLDDINENKIRLINENLPSPGYINVTDDGYFNYNNGLYKSLSTFSDINSCSLSNFEIIDTELDEEVENNVSLYTNNPNHIYDEEFGRVKTKGYSYKYYKNPDKDKLIHIKGTESMDEVEERYDLEESLGEIYYHIKWIILENYITYNFEYSDFLKIKILTECEDYIYNFYKYKEFTETVIDKINSKLEIAPFIYKVKNDDNGDDDKDDESDESD